MSIYETHVMPNPQLPFIFYKNTVHKPYCGYRQFNWHENVEIIYISKGNGIITVDTRQLHVEVGNIVVINPNCLHKFEALNEEFCYHCLIVDRNFCRANYFDTNQLRFELSFRDDSIGDLICSLAHEYSNEENEFAYRTQMIRALILQIMALLCRNHQVHGERISGDSYPLSCIKQAIGYIRAQSDRDLSLDEVSSFVGLSKYHFAREFRRITGYTFVSYINMTRCEKAKVLLSENRMTVGEVGKVCGFGNQSYFSRTFRKYTGVLPSAYHKET